jgi:hypothetical protein
MQRGSQSNWIASVTLVAFQNAETKLSEVVASADRFTGIEE